MSNELEKEVLDLFAQGLTIRDIAKKLSVSRYRVDEILKAERYRSYDDEDIFQPIVPTTQPTPTLSIDSVRAELKKEVKKEFDANMQSAIKEQKQMLLDQYNLLVDKIVDANLAKYSYFIKIGEALEILRNATVGFCFANKIEFATLRFYNLINRRISFLKFILEEMSENEEEQCQIVLDKAGKKMLAHITNFDEVLNVNAPYTVKIYSDFDDDDNLVIYTKPYDGKEDSDFDEEL